jgi:hypothetical protein
MIAYFTDQNGHDGTFSKISLGAGLADFDNDDYLERSVWPDVSL